MTPRHGLHRRARSLRHARRLRRHPIARGTALALAAVLSFTVTGAATGYARLQGNIDSANVDHLLGDDRPEAIVTEPDPDDPNRGVPVNLLVMGSDVREPGSVVDDGVDGQRSDTTIVVHISADRQRVDLVSIPRDSLVDIPECMRSDGTTSRAYSDEMFNAAFAIGVQSGELTDAAACTQRTVEQNTGVRIDHFVIIDMAGFVKMVDALGGVEICIPQEIYSPKANNLHLQPGNQVLDGALALSYARARTGEGLDGSDTSRIGRQQGLLAATAQGVLSKNLLTDVPELYRFFEAVTQSLTVSSGIASIPAMTGLAFSLRGVPSGNITFMTIPFTEAPTDRNRVVWTEEADAIWANMAADVPLVPGAEPAEPAAPADPAEPEPADSAEPADPQTPEATVDPVTPSTPAPEPGVDPFTPDDIPAICG